MFAWIKERFVRARERKKLAVSLLDEMHRDDVLKVAYLYSHHEGDIYHFSSGVMGLGATVNIQTREVQISYACAREADGTGAVVEANGPQPGAPGCIADLIANKAQLISTTASRFRICDHPEAPDPVLIDLPEGKYSIIVSYRREPDFIDIDCVAVRSGSTCEDPTRVAIDRVVVDSGSLLVLVDPLPVTPRALKEEHVELSSGIGLWVLSSASTYVGVRVVPPFGDGTYKVNQLFCGTNSCGFECHLTRFD